MAKFKVSARTIDMLGRQQIAGIPTAISELFKNAHDAYAEVAEVDYFRDDGLFVLRDDGLGMTKEDFETRWLTLGTDSKLQGGSLEKTPVDKTKAARPILGEKGIGRLAIALIGSQVLILSRAKRDGKAHNKTVAAYIHWGLFELPGLDLSEITIPIKEFEGGTLPNQTDIKKMTDEAHQELKKLDAISKSANGQKILKEIQSFSVDPNAYQDFLKEPNLASDGTGTHFFIKPADPIIEEDLDDDSEGATRFERNLIGFTNTMTPGHKPPLIRTSIRDHRDEGDPIEIIGQKTFFTPEEFLMVDHHIHGSFDEYGQFRGSVGIYQTEPEDYILNWPESSSTPTACGPFDFSFAFLQGNLRDSLVPPDEHGRIKQKLGKFGGLYVYRDGIRVQPYGDSDYDFLHIEKRRTLKASYYFYSYRRIMGTIELSSKFNPNLIEKAGREGFSENKAYRQFRSILMNFFVQSAADFFRQDGRFSHEYIEKNDELKELFEIKKQNEKKRKQKKERFTSALDLFFETYDPVTIGQTLKVIVDETALKLDLVTKKNADPQQKALSLLRIEKDQREKIEKIRSRFTLSMPRGLVTNLDIRNEWAAYRSDFSALESKLLAPIEEKLELMISEFVKNSKIPLQAAKRLEERVKFDERTYRKEIETIRKNSEQSLKEIATKVKEVTRHSFNELNSVTNTIIEDIGNLKKVETSSDKYSQAREKFEQRLLNTYDEERKNLERLSDQIDLVSQAWQDGYSSIELTEALEYQVEELESQYEVNLELAQIGMAINAINHEFEKTVEILRNGFRRLNKWAEINPDLRDLNDDMRKSFDHLDGYLTLLTPFDKRLNRQKVDIRGKDIHGFIEDLFEARLKRHDIKITPTDNFTNAIVSEYTSTFYPVFVNLVDNSIFWLKDVKDRKGAITFDFKNGSFIIEDNGPGIQSRDRDNVFQLRFSRKPMGRGMGLYISKETLGRAGYDLLLDQDKSFKGARFIISPKSGA